MLRKRLLPVIGLLRRLLLGISAVIGLLAAVSALSADGIDRVGHDPHFEMGLPITPLIAFKRRSSGHDDSRAFS